MTQATTRTVFARYVALGDSMSIDDYPVIDWQERHGLSAPVPGLGASSLLYHNNDDVWPAFRGLDLHTSSPAMAHECLATDGARTRDVLANQLPQLEARDSQPTLVTLTAGGNDLLDVLRGQTAPEPADAILGRIEEILARLERLFPDRTVLVGTVYDPTDGGPDLMGVRLGERERGLLARVNEGIRDLCSARASTILADVAAHFHGHGLSAPPAHRWYWEEAPIEPSAMGASELRRLWLKLLGVQTPLALR